MSKQDFLSDEPIFDEQLSLFDSFLLDKEITKKVRLISFFSGIEAQFKALSFLGKKLGVEIESYKTCEWAYNSIIACNAIHLRDFYDYSGGKTKEEMIDHIRGISINYNEPLTDEQLNRKPLEWIKNAYNNCVANHNLINIMNVHGDDLEIVDLEKFEYILTYSFPCQDLSLAGKRGGMSVSQKDGGTRSGLLWEVERILSELDFDHRPQILLMENVPQVHSFKDYPHFEKWMLKLESLGYSNYYSDLNAKGFGIPQNRDRTFMVSIKKEKNGDEYNYHFPVAFKREYNLKDMLESNVDEKYYLSQKLINCFMSDGTGRYPRKERFLSNINRKDQDVGNSITTLAGQRATDNFIVDGEYGIAALNETIENQNLEDGDFIDAYNRKVKKDVAGTITTRVSEANNTFVASEYKGTYDYAQSDKLRPTEDERFHEDNDVSGTILASGNQNGIVEEKIKIKNATKQGYLEAEIGDGIDISSRMQHHRGTVQKGMSQTITTKPDVGVLVDEDQSLKEQLCDDLIEKGLVKEGDCVNHSYSNSRMDNPVIANREYNDCSPTLTTRPDTLGVTVKDESMFTESEKELFTEDGNIRRYVGSEQIDKLEEGGMATTTFPNGYGHGSRTHKDCSVTLNTIDKPVVKQNLRIRKLTPKEAMRLMGFQDIDCDHMKEVGLSDAAIYHCAGDSIVVTVLIGIFAKLFGLNIRQVADVIKDYIKTIKRC